MAGRSPWLLPLLLAVLLGGLAAGIWGTVLRPPAYELRGEVIARPAPDRLVVRHDAVAGLGMAPMEMTLAADPRLLEAAGVGPGARVRVAVRPEGERLVVLRVEVVR